MEAFVAIGLIILAPGLMGWKYGLDGGSNYGYIAAVAVGMTILSNAGGVGPLAAFGLSYAVAVTFFFLLLAIPFTIGAFARRWKRPAAN
jgi:hypothetical protein